MNCVTLLLQPVAMATTQLACVIPHQDRSSWDLVPKVKHKSLRMSWVVVTDEAGRRQLRIHWVAVENDV
ncbi:MAG: hypothetical protein WB711_10440 [Terriglobales bacterium]